MGQIVHANLTGEEEGEYELDTKSGMLLKRNITSHVKGTIQMTGKEVPVSIEIFVAVKSKKID